MQNNCTSLETSKRLTLKGFPPETYYHWMADANPDTGLRTWPWSLRPFASYQSSINRIDRGETLVHAAPTATEIYLASGKDPRCNLAMPEDAAAAWLNLENKRV